MSKRDRIKRLRAKRVKSPKPPERLNAKPAAQVAPAEPRPRVVRPTPERLAKGGIDVPKGAGAKEGPAIVRVPDCIAALCIPGARRITQAQENAARGYEVLRRAVRADWGISEGRSCLDISPVGHDDGDGDEALAEEWRRVRSRLGPRRVTVLDATIMSGKYPLRIEEFREALDVFDSC